MVSIKLNLVVWRWKVFEVVVKEDVDMKFVLDWGVFQHFKQWSAPPSRARDYLRSFFPVWSTL